MADVKDSPLAKSSVVMAIGTVVSRILGFARVILLAMAVGVTIGGAADAFDVANKVPNTLYMLLAGGVLNAVFVPQLVAASKHHDEGRDFVNRLLTFALLMLIAFTVTATLCAPVLIRIYSAPTWPAEQTALAIAFAVWCLPQLFFYGLYTVLGQVLNARSSFGPYMWAPVANNLVAMIGLIIFIALFGPGETGQHPISSWNAAKIALLAGSATAGVACQALILIPSLRRIGFRYTPTFGFRGRGLGNAARVAGWAFASLLVGHLGFIVISQVASTATSAGEEAIASNAAYSLSYLVFMLPHSIVAVSLATALLPALSRSVADDDTDGIRRNLTKSVRVVGLVNVFASVTLIVLSDQVAMVLGGGSSQQADAIGLVIKAMAIGLVPFSASYLFQRVFYAYENARTPFFIRVFQVLLTTGGVTASAFLPQELVVAGIGASMSLGYLLAVVLTALHLRRRIRHLGGRSLLIAHLKFAVAAVVTTGAGWTVLALVGPGLDASRGSAFLTMLAVVPSMLLAYILTCCALRVSELSSLLGMISGRRGRHASRRD
ncbi:putative peptidoglycan lipid II flippase [Brevibacterium sandarakinum]|uniref:Peptidoglycan lipid II flippase n=1 Tax=Brevibacterium sandarakinum TaxID=629680 RepID=A0A1H1Q0V2_BRESA|nr:murein biosynthesis integral membrane protein MurJ [Brevibacterium sandarakinum]SDS17102.1 putative peptidoglycan lipid II flippase [Brevibacterium sandarakinum]